MLIVEGKSDAAFFRALDCYVADLTTERTRFSRAHEQLHQALEIIVIDSNAMRAIVFESLFKCLARHAMSRPWLADTPASFTAAADDRSAQCPHPAKEPDRPPVWCTNTFVGLPAPTWVSSGNASSGGLPPVSAGQDVGLVRSEPPRITVRVSADNRQLLTDLLAALLRFLDFLTDMVRLFDRAIEAACLIRLIVRSGLRHRPNAVALVLIMLATCRHYGHRSEPDDHASLLNRQHLVIRGSCP